MNLESQWLKSQLSASQSHYTITHPSQASWAHRDPVQRVMSGRKKAQEGLALAIKCLTQNQHAKKSGSTICALEIFDELY